MSYTVCKSCGAEYPITARTKGMSRAEPQCNKCWMLLCKAIKRARLRRDTYDLAVSEWRKMKVEYCTVADAHMYASLLTLAGEQTARTMHDAGFRSVTLTQIGLGY